MIVRTAWGSGEGQGMDLKTSQGQALFNLDFSFFYSKVHFAYLQFSEIICACYIISNSFLLRTNFLKISFLLFHNYG